MERKTILYRGKKYHRYPKSKRRQHRAYFWRHDKWKEPPVALHRQIWIDNFGKIPKGCIIHHRDDNTLNNSPENLEILTRSQHAKLHMRTPERRKQSSETGKKQAKRIVRQLKEWRQNNPELANKIARENGRRQAKQGTKVLKQWRTDNPEKYKEMQIRNGRKQANRIKKELKKWRNKHPEWKE